MQSKGLSRVFSNTTVHQCRRHRRHGFDSFPPLAGPSKIKRPTGRWRPTQQYVNREFPDVQAGFRKGRGTRDQIANICWIMEKAREFQTSGPSQERTGESGAFGLWPHPRGSSRISSCDGVSREVPCSALKGETVPDSLPATPKSPPTSKLNYRSRNRGTEWVKSFS